MPTPVTEHVTQSNDVPTNLVPYEVLTSCRLSHRAVLTELDEDGQRREKRSDPPLAKIFPALIPRQSKRNLL